MRIVYPWAVGLEASLCVCVCARACQERASELSHLKQKGGTEN